MTCITLIALLINMLFLELVADIYVLLMLSLSFHMLKGRGRPFLVRWEMACVCMTCVTVKINCVIII